MANASVRRRQEQDRALEERLDATGGGTAAGYITVDPRQMVQWKAAKGTSPHGLAAPAQGSAEGSQGLAQRQLVPRANAGKEFQPKQQARAHRRLVPQSKPATTAGEPGASEAGRMKCILARQTLVPPLSPRGPKIKRNEIEHTPPCVRSPRAELNGEAPSAGRVKAEQQQKQQLKEERRQLGLMREEVIRTRMRRQTEAVETADTILKGAPARGQVANANSQREVPASKYCDEDKLRTFRAAKLRAVPRGSNAHPTAVPAHSPAGVLLRQIGSPRGSARPQEPGQVQPARTRSVLQARPGAYSNVRQRPTKQADPCTNRSTHEQPSNPHSDQRHWQTTYGNSYKTQQQQASERLQAAALRDRPVPAGVHAGLMQLCERDPAKPTGGIATAPSPSPQSGIPSGNSREQMWSKLFTITSRGKRRRQSNQIPFKSLHAALITSYNFSQRRGSEPNQPRPVAESARDQADASARFQDGEDDEEDTFALLRKFMEFREELMAFSVDESLPLTEEERNEMVESQQPAILCTFLNLVHAQGHGDEATGESEDGEAEQADTHGDSALASGTGSNDHGWGLTTEASCLPERSSGVPGPSREPPQSPGSGQDESPALSKTHLCQTPSRGALEDGQHKDEMVQNNKNQEQETNQEMHGGRIENMVVGVSLGQQLHSKGTIPTGDPGGGPQPGEPSQSTLKPALAHKTSSPRMVARARRVAQSEELADSNSEQKVARASTKAQDDQRGLTVEYQNQSHFQPVPIYQDESARQYAQRIRGAGTASGKRLQQDGKGPGGRRPQYHGSCESSGRGSGSLVKQKLSLKKVHSRYISQSLGRAATAGEQQPVRVQANVDLEAEPERSKRKATHKAAGSQGAPCRGAEEAGVVTEAGADGASMVQKPGPTPTDTLLNEAQQDQANPHRARDARQRGLNDLQGHNRLLTTKAAVSCTQSGIHSLHSTAGNEYKGRSSGAIHDSLGDNGNAPGRAAAQYHHRGSVPTQHGRHDSAPGAGPRGREDTPFESREYDVNLMATPQVEGRQTSGEDAAFHRLLPEGQPGAQRTGLLHDYGHHSSTQQFEHDTPDPFSGQFKGSLTAGGYQIKDSGANRQSQTFAQSRHALSKEGRNQSQALQGGPDRPQNSRAEASKPATSFAQRRDVQNASITAHGERTRQPHANTTSEKINQYTIERALRTAQIASRQQSKNNTHGSQASIRVANQQNSSIWQMPLNSQLELPQGQPAHREIANNEFAFQNVTPAQRIPEFRKTTTIPKSYQQFVATVNSGSTAVTHNGNPGELEVSNGQVQSDFDIRTAVNNGTFLQPQQSPLIPLHQSKEEAKRAYLQSLQQGVGGRKGKDKKEAIMKMISQLEFGDKSESFRSAAKQFYVQNVLNQTESQGLQRKNKKSSSNQPHALAQQMDGPKSAMNQAPAGILLSSTRDANTAGRSHREAYGQVYATPQTHHSKKGRQLISNATVTDAQVLSLQKQLWQQFQLLRILKQNQGKQQKPGHNRSESSKAGGFASQAMEYGFELTEEEMYQRLFCQTQPGKPDSKLSTHSKQDIKRSIEDDRGHKAPKKNAPYASFDCPECIQMANLMLEEELKFYMQRNTFKRKGDGAKGRSAGKHGPAGKSQHKGIAGLQTHGVSITNYSGLSTLPNTQGSLDCINGVNVQQLVMKSVQNMNQKKARSQTQQTPGAAKRIPGIPPNIEPHMLGTIYVNRVSPQVFFKRPNANFRQVIRGEQMTHHLQDNAKLLRQQQNCTCGAFVQAQQQNPNQSYTGAYANLYKGSKNCACSTIVVDDMFNFTNTGGFNATNKSEAISYGLHGMQLAPGVSNLKDNSNSRSVRTGTPNKVGGAAKAEEKKAIKDGKDPQNANNENAQSSIHVDPKDVLDGTSQVIRKSKQAKIYRPKVPQHRHLETSQINQTIQKVNEVVLTLFKGKIKSTDQNLIKLFRYFQIPIPRGNGVVLDTNMTKSPDFHHSVNQKLMQKLYQVLNRENNNIKPETTSSIYRFYVGKGNNYPSVRQIISKRSWWNRVTQKQEKFYGESNMYQCNDSDVYASISSDPDNQLTNKQYKLSSGCHFIWTQWRKTEHHQFLKKVAKERAKIKAKDGKESKGQDKEGPLLNPAHLANLPTLIYNRLEDNYHLSNKKALFRNVSNYYNAQGICPFEVAIPLTFNIKSPSNSDPEYIKFQKAYKEHEIKKDPNIWIIKPGENSNRGTGIQVANSLAEIRQIVHSMACKAGGRTSIVQKYIDRPLLIHGRKFDIRGYAMMTSINGALKGYMYRDCYFRTSSKQFDLSNLHSKYIHLTNDAIQMHSEDYGKFESGNKLSINDFQRYIDQNHGHRNISFMRDLFPTMERLVTDSFRAVGSKIDPQRVANCFEIFGYDFMIDENFKVYLIECNTNPCLEICSPLLARIIPELLDNSFRIAIDPLYQPIQFMASLKAEAAEVLQNSKEKIRDNDNSVERQGSTVEIAHHSQSTTQATTSITVNQPEQDTVNLENRSPKKAVVLKKKEENKDDKETVKRQRLELLTQIKYTLVYDERADRDGIDKFLKEYEDRQRSEGIYDLEASSQTVVDAISGEVIQMESSPQKSVHAQGDDLFRECAEEEKLDEQAAKKEEIEAAEDEENGISPNKALVTRVRESDDDTEGDDDVTDEECFN